MQAMQTIVITGANRGIGLATARILAREGRRLILLCRNEKRGREALESLPHGREESPHRLILADLASLESVEEAAQTVLDLGFPLEALVNNAAIIPEERQVSEDGYELQLAVTHLAHFLLTDRLLPLLKQGAGVSRIITVSSKAHRGPPFDFSDPNCERKRYRRVWVYQQSKLANVLFTLALARRLEGTGVEAVALHPGVYDTPLLRNFMRVVPGGEVASKIFGGDAEDAGPILAKVAAGRKDEKLAGTYLHKGVVRSPSRAARDERAQERLWTWSADAVGV